MFENYDDKYSLLFSESQYKESTQVHDDGNEDVWYNLGYSYKSNGLVKDIVRYSLNPYKFNVERSVCGVEPDEWFICDMYTRHKKQSTAVIVQIHHHKFTEGEPSFSSLDDETGRFLYEDAKKISPNTERIVQIVFNNGKTKYQARYLDNRGEYYYFKNIHITGPTGIQIQQEQKSVIEDIKEVFSQKDTVFEKNVMAWSKEGCEKIKNTKIAIVGLGGLGSAIAFLLSRSGFQNLY